MIPDCRLKIHLRVVQKEPANFRFRRGERQLFDAEGEEGGLSGLLNEQPLLFGVHEPLNVIAVLL